MMLDLSSNAMLYVHDQLETHLVILQAKSGLLQEEDRATTGIAIHILHRVGAAHAKADALSRWPCSERSLHFSFVWKWIPDI
ncbi:hypothetical protein TNCV_208691 [Trichonephila clavipes]|uniref:Uncharacterized protein n=1 Tax=Trichonephila clavipes TaxID=2585209 RepID=A0A8X6SUG1_TRICX|nr:hypothetical protein TNCV_208691 [Trichonephila clavipes]